MGTYTDITIVAPSSAPEGSRVNVEVRIKNIWTYGFNIYCVGVLDTTNRFIDWEKQYIGAGQTKSFYGDFIMPSKDSVINARSYYEDAQGMVHSDDAASKRISVEALRPAEFRNLVCSYGRV